MTSEILSETPISAYQLREELKKIKQKDTELNYRAAKAEEHLDHTESGKNRDALIEKISKLNITRLREQHINKIVDIMPITIRDVKVVMQGYTINLNNENMKKIVEVVNNFIGKK